MGEVRREKRVINAHAKGWKLRIFAMLLYLFKLADYTCTLYYDLWVYKLEPHSYEIFLCFSRVNEQKFQTNFHNLMHYFTEYKSWKENIYLWFGKRNTEEL